MRKSPAPSALSKGLIPVMPAPSRTNENGFYEIRDVDAGRPYEVKVRAAGFAEWDFPALTLDPGQSEILDVPNLRIEEVQTSVTVTPQSSDEIATEQVKADEKQRGFGIIPNFYAECASNLIPRR